MEIEDIYTYTDQLNIKLNKEGKIIEISKEFNEIKENCERVKYLEKLLIENDLIPKIKDFHKPKNNELSSKYREEGNKFYKNHQFIEALECYNKSLSFSEKNHENIGAAYANRSAIYYELKLYKRSLKNIELAIQNQYPQKSIHKLIKRRELCESSLQNDVETTFSQVLATEYLKLTHEPNPKMPFIANCLELKTDDQFGRYIVTNKDLSSGDIIGIEEPFSKCLLPISIYKYCLNCLRNNFLDLIPCENCTAALFCSEECHLIAKNKFHNFECNIIGVLNAINTKVLRLANHTFYEALYAYDSCIEQLMSTIDENKYSSVTVYDLNFECESESTKKQVFKAVYSLVTNEMHRTTSDLFQRAGIVAILTYLLLNFTTLKQILNSDEKRNFYRNFLMKLSQISALNFHGIFDGILTRSQINDTVQHASASYPFCSLINHSCAPNMVRVIYDSKNYMMINRPVKAGEQLFDNYGFHHCLESKVERQSSLKKQYMFQCACEACQNNYPQFSDLKYALQKPIFNYDDIGKLEDLDLEVAVNRIKYFCNTIDTLDREGFYPSQEISSLQECLLRCLFIFKMTKFNLEVIKRNR